MGEWNQHRLNAWTATRQEGNLRMNLRRNQKGWFGHLLFKGVRLDATFETSPNLPELDVKEIFEKWATTEVLKFLSE